MAIFLSFPAKLRLWCEECKRETEHRLVGFVKNGLVYECVECGRRQILSRERVEYELRRMAE